MRTIKTWAGVDLVTGMPVLIYTMPGAAPRLPEVFSEHLPAVLETGETAIEGGVGAYVVAASAPGYGPVRFPVSGERLRWLARSSARAVADAHGAGLVHRDLKPEHFYAQGEHLLIDGFGLPWSDEPSPYRAPEGRGQPPADVYAWARSLQALGRNDPGRALDGELGRLVGHCLSARPVERPTAPELVQALEKILAEPEPAARDVGGPAPAPAAPVPLAAPEEQAPPALTGPLRQDIVSAALSLQPPDPPAEAGGPPVEKGHPRPTEARRFARPRLRPVPQPERREDSPAPPPSPADIATDQPPDPDPARLEPSSPAGPTVEAVEPVVAPPTEAAVEPAVVLPEPVASVVTEPAQPAVSDPPAANEPEPTGLVELAEPEAVPAIGAPYPEAPAVAVRRSTSTDTPPKPIRIGFGDDNSWRPVMSPATARSSRNARARAAALVAALAIVIGLAVVMYPRFSGGGSATGPGAATAPASQPAPAPPAAIIVTFKLTPAEAVGGRLAVLEAPAAAKLKAGQLLAMVPGPVSFPAPGRYKLRVSLEGYEPTDFEKEVTRDEDVLLALK